MTTSETVYLALGSNIGDREQFLAQALRQIAAMEGMEVIASSALYISAPSDMPDGSPPFLNQVVKADYQYSPGELLQALEQIEQDLGRTDKGELLPRTIDLDILFFGNRRVDEKLLTIPHPKMLERPFVMVPLLQIDPTAVHPISGKPLSDFVTTGGRAAVRLYKDHVARQV